MKLKGYRTYLALAAFVGLYVFRSKLPPDIQSVVNELMVAAAVAAAAFMRSAMNDIIKSLYSVPPPDEPPKTD